MKEEYDFSYIYQILNNLPQKPKQGVYYNTPLLSPTKNKVQWEQTILEFEKLKTSVPEWVVPYLNAWGSDLYVGLGEIKAALDCRPKLNISSRGSVYTDNKLSLKYYAGFEATGDDLLSLFGPKVTNFGKKYLNEISQYLNIKISNEHRHNSINLLSSWVKLISHHKQDSYYLFLGVPVSLQNDNINSYTFSLSPEIEKECAEYIRDAENTIRDEMSIPRVGEGWVQETELFYFLKKIFPYHVICQHGRPQWLGRQHLDVYFPDCKVAIEFQGLQHDQPIAFFGGEKAFKENMERDKKKARLCKKHGVTLIYVRPGYDKEDLISKIKASF